MKGMSGALHMPVEKARIFTPCAFDAEDLVLVMILQGFLLTTNIKSQSWLSTRSPPKPHR